MQYFRGTKSKNDSLRWFMSIALYLKPGQLPHLDRAIVSGGQEWSARG